MRKKLYGIVPIADKAVSTVRASVDGLPAEEERQHISISLA